MPNTKYRILNTIKLRTWVALGIIMVLLPIVVFRVIYGTFGATGGSDANPAAHWPFDEGAANTCSGGANDACDISGNSNDGAFAAAAPDIRTEDLCVSGKCLLFNGTDDSVTVANTVSNVRTVTFWVKVMSTSTTQEILALNASDYFTSVSGTVTVNGFGTDTIYVDGRPATTLTANKWHHVAVTSDTNTSASAITIGNVSTNFGNIFLDEVKLLTTELSAGQVKAEFAGGAAVFADKSAFLSDGLTAYYEWEDTGTTVTDSSGNGNSLTETNTVANGNGKFGLSGDFELDTSEYASVADNASLSITGSLTLAAWIMPEAIASGTYNVIAKWGGSTDSYRLATIADGTNHEVRLELESDNNYQQTTASDLVASTWYHIVGVYDSQTATAKIYINGTEATSSTTGTIPSSITDDAGAFNLGVEDSGGTPANYYDGRMDEVRVYSRALSSSEVRSLYNWAAGPIGYWKLDENTGSSAADSSGNGENGTFGGNTSWANGKFGAAASFDGTDDYISMGDQSPFDFGATASFTASAWIRLTNDFGTDRQIISKSNCCTLGGWEFLFFDFDNTLGVTFNDTVDTYEVTTTATISENTWTHVAMVLTERSSVKLYINGAEQALNAASGTLANVGSLSTTYNLCIGLMHCAGGNYDDWQGQIDEVRVYNYPRTSSQIVEDMNGGHPAGGSPIGSQAIYWKLDTGYGTTAYNDVDANTDGTIAGANWLTSGSCKINGCLNFDAAAEAVTIATASDALVDFNSTEKFSLGAWIYVVTAPGATDENLIIGKWDETGAAEQRGYRLYITDADTDNAINLVGELYDESANQTLSAATTNEPIALNTWYHVVLTHNGGIAGAAGDLETYINGNSVATNSANASFLGVDDVTSDFTVGDYDATDGVSGNTAFTGRIDEVQIYSDELTADQVKVVANAGSNAAFGVLATTSEEADVAGSQGNPPYVWLSFDENSGTTANDTSGNSRTGTFGSQAAYRPGKFGSAAYFNGTSTDNTSFTDDSTVHFTNDALDGVSTMTVSFWFKPEDTGDSWQDMFGVSTTGATGNILEIAYEPSPTKRVNLYTAGCDGGTDVVGYIALPDPQTGWHQFTYTDDTSGNKKWYIDGVQQTPTYTSGSGASCTIGNVDDGTTPYTIGCWALNGSTQDCYTAEMYEGYIDEFKIYNYVRTPAQVAYDYNRGSPLAWYKIDDCTGTTVNDLSLRADLGNALDGTWSGAGGSNTSAGTCSAVDTATAWYNGRVGKMNYSLDFDGTDDAVAVTNADAIDLNVGLTNGFTFAAWIYPNSDGETDVGEIFDKGTDTYCRTDSDDATYVDIECRVDLTTDAAFNVSDACLLNQWCHVAFAWTNDADDEVTIWINGNANTSSATFSGDPAADANNLTIGGTPNFDGQIDDFRVFPYELTAAQVKKVMNDGSGQRFGPATGTP